MKHEMQKKIIKIHILWPLSNRGINLIKKNIEPCLHSSSFPGTDASQKEKRQCIVWCISIVLQHIVMGVPSEASWGYHTEFHGITLFVGIFAGKLSFMIRFTQIRLGLIYNLQISDDKNATKTLELHRKLYSIYNWQNLDQIRGLKSSRHGHNLPNVHFYIPSRT